MAKPKHEKEDPIEGPPFDTVEEDDEEEDKGEEEENGEEHQQL